MRVDFYLELSTVLTARSVVSNSRTTDLSVTHKEANASLEVLGALKSSNDENSFVCLVMTVSFSITL